MISLKTPLLKGYKPHVEVKIETTIMDLPDGPIRNILSFLDPKELSNANTSSTLFRNVLSFDEIYTNYLDLNHDDFKKAFMDEGSYTNVFKNHPHIRKKKFQSYFFPKKIARAIKENRLNPKRAYDLNEEEKEKIDLYYSPRIGVNCFIISYTSLLTGICVYSFNNIMHNDPHDLPASSIFIPIAIGFFSSMCAGVQLFTLIENLREWRDHQARPLYIR